MKTFKVQLQGEDKPLSIKADYQVTDGAGTRLYVKSGKDRDPATDEQVASFYSGQVMACYPASGE